MMIRISHPGELSTGRIVRTWWPLAASWLLMGAELPALSAVMARLPNPEINLAAYGGIVFPIALIIEAPIIMLLAASTALSKDLVSYQKLRRFMMVSGAALTGLHILIAFTPLYYFVVERIIGAPQVIVEPGRVGLMLMTPWTWSIAYRRFNQGVLIRFDRSKSVGVGTAVRLTADLVVLLGGYAIGTIPGIVVATCAVSAGVISEAIFAGIVTRPVVAGELRQAPRVFPELTLRDFLDFYIPLAMTSLLFLLVQPMGSAALSRLPRPLESLAVWPVVSGLIFMLRSAGVAYNEVVVALLDEPRSSPSLRRFTTLLTVSSTLLLFLVAATPLSELWFGGVQGLSPQLAALAVAGLWISLPMPGLSVLQSWYQGMMVHDRRTRGITESVVVFLVTSVGLLFAGVVWGGTVGLFIGLAVFVLANTTQTAWLWYRSRPAEQVVRQRDLALENVPAAEATTD
jgi:progressive ankylosis protein